MNRFRTAALTLASFVAVIGVTLAAESIVNQGTPGKRGPWPVSTVPFKCSTIVHSTVSVGVAAVDVPDTQSSRQYVSICVSLENTGTPLVKCLSDDATSPVMGAGNEGDVLGVGDCLIYPVGAANTPRCIASAAATYVTTFECD